MKTVAEVIGVSRSNLIDRMRERPKKRIGRPPLPDDKLVAEIKAVIAELPTYGYRRVHAILKRQALAAGSTQPPNHKRVYRVMNVHGLLLDRHAGGVERRHDGRIAVDARNRRWCSDGFEIGCDNGERVRVAFALDCCDREAMSFLATTSGVSGEDVRDLMLAAVEHRFGLVNRLPITIEWLSDNGSCYVAGEIRSFARDIGLEPRTTPIESPQSNGMAEASPHIKRDTSTSVRARMHRPSCTSYQLGLITTTRFTPTRHSDIVHRELSQLGSCEGGGTNRNLSRLIIASNEKWVVPAGIRARRWCVLDVSDTHANDRAYFGAIDNELHHDGGLARLMHVLQTFDLGSVDVYAPPKTAALLEQKEKSFPPHVLWWAETLNRGTLRYPSTMPHKLGQIEETDSWPDSILKLPLWEAYALWMREHNIRSRILTADSLHRWFKEAQLLPGSTTTRSRTELRARRVSLPPLRACRQAFDAYVAQPRVWEPEEGPERTQLTQLDERCWYHLPD